MTSMADRRDKIKQEVMDAGYLDTAPDLWTIMQEQNESLDGNQGDEEQPSAENKYEIYYMREEDCIEIHLQDEDQTSSVSEKRKHLQTNINQEPDKKVCRKKRTSHLTKEEGFQEQQSEETDESEIYYLKEGDLSGACHQEGTCHQEEHHESLAENHDIQEQQAEKDSGYEIFYSKKEKLLEPCLQEDISGMNATTQSSIHLDDVLRLDNPLQRLRCQIETSSDRVSAERKQTNIKQEPDRKDYGQKSTFHLTVEKQRGSCNTSEGRCDFQMNSSSRNCDDDKSNVSDTESDGYSDHDGTCSVGKAHSCSYCINTEVFSMDHLAIHKTKHTVEKGYNCSEFNRNSFSPRGLYMEVHAGEKPYQCCVCNHRFSRKFLLARHMLIHTGEKPYQCSVCNQKFSRKSHVTRHMLIHTGEKPYQCSVCNQRFSTKSHLTSHMIIHTGEKAYQCSVCNQSFSRKSDLTRHIRIHTGEKPYQCSVCNKSFSTKCILTAHIRIHSGEKPYQCSVCNQSFPRKSNLTSHMIIHTGEKT